MIGQITLNVCHVRTMYELLSESSLKCLINIVTGHRGSLTLTPVLMLMYVVSRAQALTFYMQGQRSTQSNRSGK